MRYTFRAAAAALFLAFSCEPTPQRKAPATQHVRTVTLETTAGNIVIQLDSQRAPKTVENFLVLAHAGFYDGLVFHRVKPHFMIQAGYVTADLQRRATSRAPIYNEADNGLKNIRGAVAMARTAFAHSATTEFFIDVVDNPKLDYVAPTDLGFGYAVFGHVIRGMSVVDSIASAPTTRREEFGDWPVHPVIIQHVRLGDSVVSDSRGGQR